ncbi:hypothetical protein DL96DRAFT_1472998, partial [Flagelloscypha sp. PMI_526]
ASLLQELRSGFIPSHSRIEDFHASLPNYQFQLEQINLELKFQSVPFYHLQAAQNQLQRFIDLPNGLFSPVRKLPVEILHLIFDHSFEQSIASNLGPISCKVPALQLSQVCFQWRLAAQSHAPS